MAVTLFLLQTEFVQGLYKDSTKRTHKKPEIHGWESGYLVQGGSLGFVLPDNSAFFLAAAYPRFSDRRVAPFPVTFAAFSSARIAAPKVGGGRRRPPGHLSLIFVS